MTDPKFFRGADGSLISGVKQSHDLYGDGHGFRDIPVTTRDISKWKCAAQAQGTPGGNAPADCDWPVCGCDPYAEKVIAALIESGALREKNPAFEYRSNITRAMLKAEPDALFVFGDNMLGTGYGGQAREMRGEPNAVGIPTKHRPTMIESAFFLDQDFNHVRLKIDAALLRLLTHKVKGGKIVWPLDGVGTGLARLETKAPKIWNYIEDARRLLSSS